MKRSSELIFRRLTRSNRFIISLGSYYQLAYGTGEGISFDLDLGDFCSRFKLDPTKTINALKFLEQDEYLSFNESVFLPSRFRFEVQNEQLYNFQIQNSVVGPIY